MTTSTHIGPRGYRLVMDSKEIIPDDPGAGTPAMVYGPRDTSGTFWCVLDTGEIDGTVEVPSDVMRWLDGLALKVDEFMELHAKGDQP
jgi:hypothetical protein